MSKLKLVVNRDNPEDLDERIDDIQENTNLIYKKLRDCIEYETDAHATAMALGALCAEVLTMTTSEGKHSDFWPSVVLGHMNSIVYGENQ